MLLAARALGLETTVTTLYPAYEGEAEATPGLPPEIHSYAIPPVNSPLGRFGPVRRMPLAEIVCGDP
ncbi:MAG TPA: hypothetical protein VJ770_27445 [Stellaceae bacterium]|nr:hypothetical protein [Stellaceae bacterium]